MYRFIGWGGLIKGFKRIMGDKPIRNKLVLPLPDFRFLIPDS